MFWFFFKFTMTTYLKKSWSMTLLFAREKNSFKYIGKPHFYYGFPLSSVCVYVHVKFDVKKKFPLLTQWLMYMLWKQLHYLPALLTGFLPLSPFDFTSPSPARWEQTFSLLLPHLASRNEHTPPTYLQTHDYPKAFSVLQFFFHILGWSPLHLYVPLRISLKYFHSFSPQYSLRTFQQLFIPLNFSVGSKQKGGGEETWKGNHPRPTLGAFIFCYFLKFLRAPFISRTGEKIVSFVWGEEVVFCFLLVFDCGIDWQGRKHK